MTVPTPTNLTGTPTSNSILWQWQAGSGHLLDGVDNVVAALSFRKLLNGATNCLQVRRASDDTTQNIGFVGTYLDISSLESFCSGTNGYVTIFYDQAGTKHATATTPAEQPMIVDNGTITDGIKFTRTSHMMDWGDVNSNITFASACSVFITALVPAYPGAKGLFINTTRVSTDRFGIQTNNSSSSPVLISCWYDGTQRYWYQRSMSWNTLYNMVSAHNTTTEGYFMINDVTTTTASSEFDTSSTVGTKLAARSDGSIKSTMNLYQVIIFSRFVGTTEASTYNFVKPE